MYVLPSPHGHELCDDEGVARVPHVLPSDTWQPRVGQDVGIPQTYVSLRKWPMLLAAACMRRLFQYADHAVPAHVLLTEHIDDFVVLWLAKGTKTQASTCRECF